MFAEKIWLLFYLTIVVRAEINYQEPHHPVYHHQKQPPVPILKQSYSQHHQGYQFSYETGNGIHAEEAGYIKNKGDKKNEILVQKGTVTYHDEHGKPITLTYIADEHGFRAEGAHLPTSPPQPEYIQKMLKDVKYEEQYEENVENNQNYYNTGI